MTSPAPSRAALRRQAGRRRSSPRRQRRGHGRACIYGRRASAAGDYPATRRGRSQRSGSDLVQHCAAGCRSAPARSAPQYSRPGNSRWPGFLRKKVTVSAACGATPRTSPVAPSTPLGTSIATTVRPRAPSASITARAGALHRTRQPRAEDAVEDEGGAIEHRRAQRLDRPLPLRRGLGRIALQRGALAEQRQPHRPAARLQDARRDKAIAAIVARPAQRRERPRRPAPRYGVGDREPRLFHQCDAWRPAGDRQPVGLAHLTRRQQRFLLPVLMRDRHLRECRQPRAATQPRLRGSS